MIPSSPTYQYQYQRELSFIEAISEAMHQEMARDERVFIIGEDVRGFTELTGTEGLLEKFGPKRVIDAPVSEEAFTGLAIGAACDGLRPILYLLFVDFLGCAMDMLYNHMAKLRYMSGNQLSVPMVVRAAMGGGYSDAAQHSQCLYATFAHLPGMKVVVPSTPYDAKGLMIAALRDPDPVVFLEHKMLYGLFLMPYGLRGPVPEEPYTVPIGKAAVRREGNDITMVTIGLMCEYALKAAGELEKEGVNSEVVDLRSLVPLDHEAILTSVKKTKRILVVDEDYRRYGLTGEIAAIIAEAGCELKYPFRRLANPDVPVPFSKPLEEAVLPSTEKIITKVREMMG